MAYTMQIFQQFEALRHAGKDACLRVEGHAGQVLINLQVHLQPSPPSPTPNNRPPPRNSPSRQRRRERRHAARRTSADAEKASENPTESKPVPLIGDAAAKVAVSVPLQAGHCGEAEEAGHPGLVPQQQRHVSGHEVSGKCLSAVNADQQYFPQCVQIPQVDCLNCDIYYNSEEHKNTDVNIQAEKMAKLSTINVCSTDIPPDPYPCRFCLLVSELPNYPSPKPTDPVCTVCRIPIDDRYNPHSCCGVVMHDNCWGQHRCIGQE